MSPRNQTKRHSRFAPPANNSPVGSPSETTWLFVFAGVFLVLIVGLWALLDRMSRLGDS
jgi:hypothetical protein